MDRGRIRLGLTTLCLASVLGCQLEDAPPPETTGPSEVTNPSGQTDAVLGSVPSAPAPTPTPDVEETQPTTPQQPAPPPPASCALPPSSPANPTCERGDPLLLAQVEAALDAVTERFPELFDFDDTVCEKCYFVRDPGRYIDEVISQLGRQGLCTDGVHEELGIKSSNDFSEQYDIILASEHIRRGMSAYRGTCRPAIF